MAEVEEEKMHAIGAMNILKSMAKQKETRQQDIQVCRSEQIVTIDQYLIAQCFPQNQIIEKTYELERLKVHLQYLQRIEAEQEDLIHNFYEDH